jgi:signal transduction histidine kinase
VVDGLWLAVGLAVGGLVGVAGSRFLRRRGMSLPVVQPSRTERIIRGLTHEIRNPLNAMSINLQLMQEDLSSANPPSPDELASQLERVRREIARLERILNDVSRFARQASAQREPTDIGRIVAEVLDFVEPEAHRLSVELVRDIEPTPMCMADATLLKQAFLNVILNAFQAMPNGGTLTTSLRHAGNCVEVRFRDTGDGVPDAIRTRLFEPFVSTKKDGTGLGLAVVKQVVDLHRGSVTVENDHGAVFTLRFPTSTGG